VEADAYIPHLRADSHALASAADGNFKARVSGCPEWKVGDLVAHTGEVHRSWAQVAERRLQSHEDLQRSELPPDDRLLDWFREGAEHLASVLENTDGSVPVWSWSNQKNVAFVKRRMAQETTVHRWDAQEAAGRAQGIDAELAADGIDELLDIFVPVEDAPLKGNGETIHLHSTEGAGEWLLTLTPEGIEVERAHRKGDVAIRGGASDLLLLMWRRVPTSSVEVLGDNALAERFLSWIDLT